MPAEQDFVHLHLHTEYSLLDGASRCAEVAATAAELGMPAVALTDHGNMYGVVPFYLGCEKAGVKPILGVESYVVPEGSRLDRTKRPRGEGKDLCHLTLLAENEQGYRNLLKMVSDSWLNGFYYKPRMDRELLEAHHDGLIAMSACLGGEVPQAILNGQVEKAKQIALSYRELFGPDHYFLELMEHHDEQQDTVNRALVEISRETGIPLVATNDVHFVKDTDAYPQDLLVCIQTGCLYDDANRLRLSKELYLRSAQQMWGFFGDLPETLLRTREIAERCNVKLRFGDPVLPEFPVPEGETAESYLRGICEERLGRFYQPVTPAIRERMDYELRIINEKGYSAYFLIVWDLIDFAKRSGMRVGPGRGSAAGSLVAYILGITELDPLRYGLFFERFLNPERPSMPDIDIDFPPERREEVVAYTIAKYGPSRTAKIITFGTMGAKAAIKDVGRVLQMPIPAVNDLTALVPDRPNVSLEEALKESDDLKARFENDPQVNNIISAALRLEGLSRHTSIHAAALVIAHDDLDNYVPLCRVSGGADVVTQFDMGAIDKIGLLKMDFLGLRTMTVVDEACRLVREHKGLPDFDVRTVPMDDPKTYELISRGDVIGVFQLESGGFQRVCRDLKPDCIDDIVALVALYRPGPMENIPVYIQRKHGQQKVSYLHPLLEPILEPTYGIIVYQEQVMQIGRDLADFTLGEADQIRKAVGKKDKATMDKVREKFIAGSSRKGIAAEIATKLMDQIEAFASYAFNKSHSACYAVVSYWTAYLKANYPHEFMAAQLTSVMDKRDKIVSFIQDTRQMGIEVRQPCVNTGGVVFEVHEDHIVYGMGAINGVGQAAAAAIVEERRANGPFADFYDFCRRIDPKQVPKANIEKLIRAGACRAFGNRQQLLDGYEAIWDSAMRAQADEAAGQGSLFGDEDAVAQDILAPRLKPLPEFDRDSLAELDTEFLGLILFEDALGDKLRKLREVELELELDHSSQLADLPPKTDVLIAGVLEDCWVKPDNKGSEFLRGKLNDGRGLVSVVLWGNVYPKYRGLAVQGGLLIAAGKSEPPSSYTGGLPGVVVSRVYAVEDWKKVRGPDRGNRSPAANGNGHANGNGASNGGDSSLAAYLPGYAAVNLRVQLGDDLQTRLQQIARVLRSHPGETPVVLSLEDGPLVRRVRLSARFCTAYSEALAQALAAVGGCVAQAE